VNPRRVFSLIGLALFFATPAAADPVGLFPTGIGSDGTLLPDGATDPHYVVLSGPVTGATTVAVTDGFPITPGLWFPNGPRSQWVAPPFVGPDDNPVGTYTFRTEFSLTELAPNFTLQGLWSTDNSGRDILINGVSTGNTNIAPGEFSFLAFSEFTVGRGFRSGVNTLDFILGNAPCGGCTNPSGLRVEFTAARPVPEPATLLLVAGCSGAIIVGRLWGFSEGLRLAVRNSGSPGG